MSGDSQMKEKRCLGKVRDFETSLMMGIETDSRCFLKFKTHICSGHFLKGEIPQVTVCDYFRMDALNSHWHYGQMIF